jgi:hypothetical protein
MREKSVTSMLAALSCVAMLGACGVYTQTTSGSDWLAAHPSGKSAAANPGGIDAQVRSVAAVEPTLRLPARIGIARLDRNGLARFRRRRPSIGRKPPTISDPATASSSRSVP